MIRRYHKFKFFLNWHLAKQVKSYIHEFADSAVFSQPFTVEANGSKVNFKPADRNP